MYMYMVPLSLSLSLSVYVLPLPKYTIMTSIRSSGKTSMMCVGGHLCRKPSEFSF